MAPAAWRSWPRCGSPSGSTADDVVVVLLPDGGRGYLGKIFNDEWMADYGFLESDGSAGTTVGDVLRGKERRDAHASSTCTRTRPCARPSTSCASTASRRCRCVKAEPPVTAGEVVGSVSEKELLDLLFSGHAHLADAARAAHVRAAAHRRRR